LGLSPHNTVAVGEFITITPYWLLRCRVAVVNALPMICEAADLSRWARGQGVIELIDC
jgi:hypothetical protein